MNEVQVRCKKYIAEVLSQRVELSEYINRATILLNVYQDNHVWDIMILINDDWFKYEFAHLHGDHFVVDDHKHEPPVFTRVKCYQWLQKNFIKRQPVALWIFQNAIIIQEQGELFQKIMTQQQQIFNKQLDSLVRRKYLELRGDRHSLRYRVLKPDEITNIILKANVVKLCFELLLLADGKPYPFKSPLSEYVRSHAKNGEEVFDIAVKFIATIDPEMTIALSDKLIEYVTSALHAHTIYSDDFLSKWWLFLD